MALASGTRFGPFEIGEAIGAGGMGEVYGATDTTLERDVAIKVLPESFAADADRVARFDREAKTLASLNHPNIAQIFGLEKSDGVTALVMELVEGPTLADRIANGPLPADEALGIAMQIADALEAAHSQNIVHRDLKPASIKVRADGTVKVLDFGIAKALDVRASSGKSPVMTTPAMTEAGVILGTAAYMSPEQARGKGVDERTDIWAFGCLLYEMLTGRPAFGGEDVTITLARILERETDLSALPATVPDALRHTIELYLRKDPRKRIADIRDVKLALEGALQRDSGATQLSAGTRSAWRRALPIAATALIATCTTALIAWTTLQPEPEPVRWFDYYLPAGQGFRNGGRPVLTLSPDGSAFAFNTLGGIFLRRLDNLEAELIPGTELSLASPAFSADGESLAYWADPEERGILRRIAVTGGASVDIAEGLGNLYGLSWESDGTIFFGQRSGIMRVPASGGTPALVIPADEGALLYGPRLLPDGDSVLFSVSPPGEWDSGQIVAQSLSTGQRWVLIEGGYDARYIPSGHLVYAVGNNLFGVAFDADRMTISGGAVPLTQGVLRANSRITGAANFDVSKDGTLVYATNQTLFGLRTIIAVDQNGGEQDTGAAPRRYDSVQVSPDGTRIAFTTEDSESDIWTLDLETQRLQRLTFDSGIDRNAIWSPDGRRIAFSRAAEGHQEIFWQGADGAGAAEPLTQGSESDVVPTGFTPDGDLLLYTPSDESGDIWTISVDGSATAGTPLLASPADERSAVVSPHGRWMAYESDELGGREVYVRPFPNVHANRWQVSIDGGTAPRWSTDGQELFYFVDETGLADHIMAERFDVAGATFRADAPRPLLLEGDHPSSPAGLFYDVRPDGLGFIVLRQSRGTTEEDRGRFIIAQNWIEELKRLMPTE